MFGLGEEVVIKDMLELVLLLFDLLQEVLLAGRSRRVHLAVLLLEHQQVMLQLRLALLQK